MSEAKSTLAAFRDAYGNLYSQEDRYVRTVMEETSHLAQPAVYVERAKRYLEAEKLGIHLSAMQLNWAKKILNIKE